MSSDEIREAFLEYFVARDHKRLRSGSLVPADFDPSVLLTTAGMHPLMPYFQGREAPPHPRLASCQKCFRTVDIENVGNTTRHLTMFEMLGNFSIGDYFKQAAVQYAWELSLDVFGFDPEQIWITVFEGDEELGLGPDDEAIEAWRAVGVPLERIVACPRSENFWQAGPTGPCGPCSELYIDRGLEFGAAEDLPGGDNERFLEYWNLVFTVYDQHPPGTLLPLPAPNIDTGLGLNRMAAIQQGVHSVFETDQFAPLIALGTELSGVDYGAATPSDRALRILADHSRGVTFLVADGVTPSNEGRGYVLRRVMRRAILHGRRLGMEPGFLPRYAEVVRELMGANYPELGEQRAAIEEWLRSEEESFGHTLEQGTRLLEELIERARDAGAEGIAAADAFRLHDTFGFPIDLTLELVAEHGLGVDEDGFELLMDEQRTRARAAGRGGVAVDAVRERAQALVGEAGFTSEFTGYATTEQETTVGALAQEGEGTAGEAGGLMLVKLVESPFYATGGGQVADHGEVACAAGDCLGEVEDVLRLGGDQVLLVRPRTGRLEPGARVIARVDARARHATEANHTATHLLHAALRTRLGDHVRQAGSYVGPDKLRFDFTHGHALSAEDTRWIEDEVNRRIAERAPVRALTTTLDEARALGAMALFGEKYGEVVRMVEVGDGFSRELCGGTHVRSTAEIAAFKIVAETSSAANVRRIEALTGPAVVALLRAHDAELSEIARTLRTTPEGARHALEQRETRRRELEKALREGAAKGGGDVADVDALAARAEDVDGARVLTAEVPGADPDALLALLDRLKGPLGDAAIVLGASTDGKVQFVASVAPALVARGVRAGEIVRAAAQVTGGGGGGRDTMARAGGRDPSKLGEAIAAARAAIEAALRG